MSEPPAFTREAELLERYRIELRRSMATMRRTLPRAAQQERAARAATLGLDALTGLASLATNPVVAAYVARDGELDPEPLLDALRARGLRVALPCVQVADSSIVLRFDEGPRVDGAFGIPEPPPHAAVADGAQVGLVLVPAVAVDVHGNRLGRGRGFYDRLLPRLGAATRVAYVHDFQLVDELPPQPHDVPVQRVVTDARVLDMAAASPDARRA